MAKTPDAAHRKTDKELAKLEQRIACVYKEAADDMQEKVTAYFAAFKERDEAQKDLIGQIVNGKEYTEDDYKQWRLTQMGRGERYQDMQSKLAERVTKANETAIAYVNDTTPGIYSLNRNYSAYTIEKVAGDVGFTMWDESTVKRLIKEQPDLMPNYPKEKAVKRGIDLAYGKKQITKNVTSGILQGNSVTKIASDLMENITTMSQTSAVRAARTAVTGAQNAGRQDSYEAAKSMGIKLKKSWLATLDNKTRHEHAALDGQQVDTDQPFEIDGYSLMYPGDPDGEPEMIYNCRCTMIAAVDGVDTSDAKRWSRNLETGEKEIVSDMTYSEWAGWKQETGNGKSAAESVIAKSTQETEIKETIIDGKNLVGDINYENSDFEYDIETAIHAQRFDGVPKVVSSEEFEAAKEKSGFYAERTYTADTKETLDEYREQLYNGKWYVDCSDGGAQYGKGMYCASTYDLSQSWQLDGIKEEMEHYQGIGLMKSRIYHYTEGITMQPDAKVFTLYSDTTDIANRYVKEYALKNATSSEAKETIRELIEIQDKIDFNSSTNFVKKVDWDFVDSLYEERQKIWDRDVYKTEVAPLMKAGSDKSYGKDGGALAAEMGYDAIMAQGHGKSGSYTVILNRTKCIFLEGGVND